MSSYNNLQDVFEIRLVAQSNRYKKKDSCYASIIQLIDQYSR